MTEQEENKQTAKYFNIGYQMQQHEPELLQKILKSDNRESEAIKTIQAGGQQFEREMIIQEQQRIIERKQNKKRGR